MQNQFLSFVCAIAISAGCASHAPQPRKANEGVTLQTSNGITVYVSKKNQEVRAGLIDENLSLLAYDSLYLYVANHGTTPVGISLSQFKLERNGHQMRLRPLREILESQERLTNEAISNANWPKFIKSVTDDLKGKTRSEVKEATRAALEKPSTPTPTPSLDPILDELAKTRLSSPSEAKDAKEALEAHKKIVAGFNRYYFQPRTLAPGESFGAIVKYEPALAPTDHPLELTVTLSETRHEISVARK